jgi:hypothetical protein
MAFWNCVTRSWAQAIKRNRLISEKRICKVNVQRLHQSMGNKKIIMGGTRDRTDLKVLVSRSAGMASALNLALCICEHDSPPPRIRRFTFWHHRRRTTRWARDFFFDWLKRKPEKGTSGPPLPKPRRLLCGLYFGTSRSPCVRKPQKI